MEPNINAPDDVVAEIARPDETRELVFHDLKDTLCERDEATERVFGPVLLLIRVDEDMIRELLPEADRENDVGTELGAETFGKVVVKDKSKLVDTVPEGSPLVVTDPTLLLAELVLPVIQGCKELVSRLVPAVVPLPVLLIDDVFPATLLLDLVPPVLQVCKELLPRLLVPDVTALPTGMLILELLIDTVLPVLHGGKELFPELVVPEVVAPLLVIGTLACPASISEPST